MRVTSSIDLSASERLRQLAIFLEPKLSWREQPRGWLVLDRIYKAALVINPADGRVWSSRALTARQIAEDLEWDNRKERKGKASEASRRTMQVARHASVEAVRLDPDAIHLRMAGDVCYFGPDGSTVEALEWYDRALGVDPRDGWSLLYRAHCLHDLKRWTEAADAYGAVDPAFLVGPKAWRYEHLLEQRAYCRLQAAHRASTGGVRGASRSLGEEPPPGEGCLGGSPC